jgi:hypothetical protein
MPPEPPFATIESIAASRVETDPVARARNRAGGVVHEQCSAISGAADHAGFVTINDRLERPTAQLALQEQASDLKRSCQVRRQALEASHVVRAKRVAIGAMMNTNHRESRAGGQQRCAKSSINPARKQELVKKDVVAEKFIRE